METMNTMSRIIKFIAAYFNALLNCLVMFTFGLFSNINRNRILKISAIFGYKPAFTSIPEVRLSELVPGDIAVQVLEPDGVSGNITAAEIIAITQLIRYYKPRRLFEIGTFNGRTTLNMAANCAEDAEIYTIDLPKDMIDDTKFPIASGERGFVDKKTSGSRFSDTEWEKQITQLYGDSAAFDFSLYFNAMDFVFLDGSHQYKYVLNDSKMALKLIGSNNGIILWHDYGVWKGVTKALEELYTHNSEFKNIKRIKGTSLVFQKLIPRSGQR